MSERSPLVSSGGRRFRHAAPWILLFLLCVGWNALMSVKRQTEFGTAWLVGLDDNFYLAWGRSLAVDGDWNFENDVAFLASLTSLPDTARAFQAWIRESPRTARGRVPNKYASGAGLLALPLLLATRLGLELAAFTGFTGPPDPFSSLYVFAFVASGVLWGFVGLMTAQVLLGRAYSPEVSSSAVLVGAIGLPLGYYVWVEPMMAHATGFGVATLHVLCARTWAERVTSTAPAAGAAWWRWAFLTGLTLGVACLARFTNIVLVVVPLVLAWSARSSPSERRRSWWPVITLSGGLVALGSVIGFLPQLIAWKVVYGAFVVDSYAGETFSVWPQHLVLVLFGPRNGLFSWTPLALVALVGVVWGIRESPLCRAGVIVLAATAWIYGGWHMYWLGHSFGMRGFVDVSVFLLVGLAEVMKRAERIPAPTLLRRAGQVFVALSLVWTLHLTVCYRAQIQPHGEPLALTPIMTEWKRWARQVYNDSGVKVLVRQVWRPS